MILLLDQRRSMRNAIQILVRNLISILDSKVNRLNENKTLTHLLWQ